MELKDQERLIGVVVDTIFIPLVLQEMAKFITEYRKQVVFARDMENITGIQVKVPMITLDIRQASTTLIEHLTIALKNETTQIETKG